MSVVMAEPTTSAAADMYCAAVNIREAILDVPSGPWTYYLANPYTVESYPDWQVGPAVGRPFATVEEVTAGPARAAYLAMMHPGVAAAIADLLCEIASRVEGAGRRGAKTVPGYIEALAVARAVLRQGERR